MVAFVIAIVLFVIALIAIIAAVMVREFFPVIIAIVAAVAGGIVLISSSYYTNSVGEAKVFVNVDGTLAGEPRLTPGSGWKAPWQDVIDYDLFSQELVYAGNGDGQPAYTGGTVSGYEVTTAVGGINGGSTQADIDISVTYSLDADKVVSLYEKYKSQERFTKQVIEKTVLSIIRQVPSDYTAVEFRGDKRAEAAESMLDLLNAKLKPLGVAVDFVNIQMVTYPEAVEEALKAVEVSNQNVLKQEAELRAKEIEAQQLVATATAQAEANRLINDSLTPLLLQQKYIDSLGEGTVYVVPDGSTPFIGAK